MQLYGLNVTMHEQLACKCVIEYRNTRTASMQLYGLNVTMHKQLACKCVV